MSKSPARGWLTIVGSLTIANLFLAIAAIPGSPFASATMLRRALVWAGMSLGPIYGWMRATMDGHLLAALPVLSVLSSPCVGAFSYAKAKPNSVTRAVFAITWFIAGYYVTVGMWI